MKHFTRFMLAVLLSLASSVIANAYDFEVDGICYKILSKEDKTCEVTSSGDNYNFYQEHIDIPQFVAYSGVTFKVTSIGYKAFAGSSGLKSVSIPQSIQTIKDRAFDWCHLDAVYISNLSSWCQVEIGSNGSPLQQMGAKLFLNGELVTNLVIPSDVTKLGNGFSWLESLESVFIPKNVVEIGEQAFFECKNLNSSKLCKDNWTASF